MKLIKLDKVPGIYTLRGQGIPGGKTLVGSLDDTEAYLRSIGVEDAELQIARDFLEQRPEHNAVEFGISLKTVVTSFESVDEIYAHLGLEKDAA